MTLNIEVIHEQGPYSFIVNYSNSASKWSMQTLGRRYQMPMPTNPSLNAIKSSGQDVGSVRKKPWKEMPTTSFNSTLINISSTIEMLNLSLIPRRLQRHKKTSFFIAKTAIHSHIYNKYWADDSCTGRQVEARYCTSLSLQNEDFIGLKAIPNRHGRYQPTTYNLPHALYRGGATTTEET